MTAVAFSRDGRLLATGGEDGSIRMWNASTFRPAAVLSDRRPGQITSLAFSPDGSFLAATGLQWGGIGVWDLATRQLLPMNHTASQFCSAFSPDGELLATGGHDRTVLLWHVRTQRLVNIIRGHGDAVDSLRFLPDGKTLVTASRDGTTRVWPVDVRQGPSVLRPGSARAVVFSPQGDRIAIATDKGVGIWDVGTERELMSLSLPAASVAVAFSPDGRRVAALVGTAAVHVFDASNAAVVTSQPGRRALEPAIRSGAIAFSPDGHTLAAVDGDRTLTVWNTQTWESRVIGGAADVLTAVAFSPDGRRLAAAGLGRTARIHDLNGPRPPILLEGHTRPMLWVGFTSDGARVVTSSFDGTVRFWDGSTGVEVKRMLRGGDLGPAVLTPGNDRLIVSGLGDPSLTFFDSRTSELLLTVRGHNAPISGLAISPDGTIVASSSNDGTVRLWRTATEKEIEAWRIRTPPPGPH